jgi:nickel transport protein
VKHNRTNILVLVIILMLPAMLYAHGVRGSVENGGMAVTAQYDTGEAMSYAKVTISAPGAKLIFQKGRTDRNGRFCFFPDTAGEWLVVVDDEIGHRLDVDIPVDEALKLKTDQAPGRPTPSLAKYEKALMGISVIFGLCGFLFWRLGMKIRRKSLEAE